MQITRRSFLKATSLATVTAAADATAATAATRASPPGAQPTAQAPVYTFLNAEELPFVEAATARLIPADDAGPGAIEAGVPAYIDKQLGGAWGAGERLFRGGPWKQGTPSQGYQLPFTPAELMRNALRAVREDVQARHGTTFDALPPETQDAYLRSLQEQPRDLHGVPSNVFFESLWALTIEGFFSDPVYGGNKDMVAWKMIGFPGAYANYYHLVDHHNLRFDRPPISLASNGRGVINIHPEIPASTGNAMPAPQAHQHGAR